MFMLSECKSTRAHQAMSSCFTEEAYFSELGLTKNRTESLVDAAPVRRKERGMGLSRTILLRVFCTGFRLSYREPCKLIQVPWCEMFWQLSVLSVTQPTLSKHQRDQVLLEKGLQNGSVVYGHLQGGVHGELIV